VFFVIKWDNFCTFFLSKNERESIYFRLNVPEQDIISEFTEFFIMSGGTIMQRRAFWIGLILCLILGMVSVSEVAMSADGSTADPSKGMFESYKVNLLEHQGGSGDIQLDQNGWIHLGANHLEGGDIKYDIKVGRLDRTDIVEVWIDGYSSSNDLNTGPTVFIGAGKNRYEQITRMTGEAWRPFVFHVADDTIYGDITDPANRNEYWRMRFPSSKYEMRRIDKSPEDLIENQVLPIRISMTGVEDFIIKRIEVVVFRTDTSGGREELYIISLNPATVHQGDMLTVQLNRAFPTEDADLYILDPSGREYRITPRILNGDRDRLGVYTDEYPFSRSGWYQIKLVDRSDRDRENIDTERFEYIMRSRAIEAIPKTLSPEEECPPTGFPQTGFPPTGLPPIPAAPPTYIAPVMPVPPASMIAPQSSYPSRGYTIQVAAYRTQSAALSLCNRLRREQFDAYVVESADKSGRLYRVRVGRYPNKSYALQDANRLRNSGFDTWIAELS
jgi:hypothetical protein